MKKKVIAVAVFFLIAASVIGVNIYINSQPQEIRSRAQVVQQSCTPPGTVNNVKIQFPNCEGAECSFNQASCSWDVVTGAANYKLKITEQDTGAVIKDETIAASVTKVVFPVVVGRTYKCDVAAVNDCGSAGGTGTDSLLCQVEGVVPTTTPSVAPQLTPVPTQPAPTAPQVKTLSCGQVGCSVSAPCIAGLECVAASNGGSFCAFPDFKAACQQSPSVNSCCRAPVVTAPPRPTLPPTGDNKTGTIIGAGAVFLMIVGGALLLL